MRNDLDFQRTYQPNETTVMAIDHTFSGRSNVCYAADSSDMLISWPWWTGAANNLSMNDLLIYILIGFIAQLINGSLGMAYGMITMSFLLAIGTPPLLANSSVQLAKVFTAGASSLSHWHYQNVDRGMLIRLAASGITGAVAGALLATSISDSLLTPFVAVYLFAMGLRMLWQIFRTKAASTQKVAQLPLLGLIGGFLNAIGGAGWGPVVTSTLLARGGDPRLSIGSVSVAEFFVSVTAAIVLVSHINVANIHWNMVAGFIIGGMGAAPLAAYLCGRLPAQALVTMVSLIIIFLSISMFLNGL
jgi:uncharacterized membrane protein YfcA